MTKHLSVDDVAFRVMASARHSTPPADHVRLPMKRLGTVLVLLVTMATTTGCGETDPNRDRKPVEPNAPRPVADGVKTTGPGGHQPSGGGQEDLKPAAAPL